MNLVTIFNKSPQTVENLGGKGHGLWQMQQAGINVPPAIIIPTSAGAAYLDFPEIVMSEVKAKLGVIQDFFIDQFGYMPLLSVRSGARVSMPGMMNTVLNVGLDPISYDFWDKKLGPSCAKDCAKRLEEMYSETVLDLPAGTLGGVPLAVDQLYNCIEAVFKSWNSQRAQDYRKQFGIPDDWGTAVVIQAMVFGNAGPTSGAGVIFTRNVDTGENKFMLNFGINAQGEDVVAGKAAGVAFEDMLGWNLAVTDELTQLAYKLELDEKDAMDIEFTVQEGKLYILQKRVAKRNAQSAVKIALDFYAAGVIDKATLFNRIKRRDFDLSQLPVIDPAFKTPHLYKGTGASSGVATGVVVHTAEAAINCQQPCILVTKETNPDDFGGMLKAQGVLTMEGGYTSHAALVARSVNKPCVVGLGIAVEGFPEGTMITIDGATGRVWDGKVPVIEGGKSDTLKELLEIMWGEVGADRIGTDYLTLEGSYLDAPADIAAFIIGKLNTSDKLYVDIRGTTETNEADFYASFMGSGDAFEIPIMEALNAAGVVGNKLILVCNATSAAESLGFKYVPAVSTLEDLVMAEGECIMSLPKLKGKAIKKVLAWQKGNLSPLSVGEVVPKTKSFISESDLVVKLLQ